MLAAYRAIRALPATARGEGGFISREIFGGAYKTAGATLFAATGSAALAVYYVHWEIIHFILTNSDLLKGYAALAFEHSPGFRQMIDWLELHLRPEK